MAGHRLHEMVGVKGLGEIGVGPALFPLAARFVGVKRRQHDHGEGMAICDRFCSPADLETVEVGKHYVENHQIRHPQPDFRNGGLPVEAQR